MQQDTPRPRRRLRLIAVVAVTAAVAAPTAVWAADAFTDVPDSNVFHDDIAWLADANVTQGCNPPDNTRFCPGDTVTREQMAAFMRRLAENQVVDAGSLGGSDPEAYQTMVFGNTPSSIATLNSGDNVAISELGFEVPVGGVAAITAPAAYYEPADGEKLLQWVQVDDTTCKNDAASDEVAYGHGSAFEDRTTITLAGTVELTAGAHTVILCAREYAGAFDTVVYGAAIQVVFSPTGAVS